MIDFLNGVKPRCTELYKGEYEALCKAGAVREDTDYIVIDEDIQKAVEKIEEHLAFEREWKKANPCHKLIQDILNGLDRLLHKQFLLDNLVKYCADMVESDTPEGKTEALRGIERVIVHYCRYKYNEKKE